MQETPLTAIERMSIASIKISEYYENILMRAPDGIDQGTTVSCSSNQSRTVRSFSMPADAIMLFVGWV